MQLTGGFNFRDLGGMAAGKKRVVSGRFLRGDGMNRLTDDDLDILTRFPLKTVIDLRTNEEAEASPDRIPASGVTRIHLPIVPGNLGSHAFDLVKTAAESEHLMHTVYSHLATDDEIANQLRTFFALLQDNANLPLLFHCTAGKDRTGITAALILSALGSDRQTIVDDYLATNRFLEPKYGHIMQARPMLVPAFLAKAEYLETFFSAMEKKHGSVEEYLEKALGVDSAALRSNHLE